MCAHCCSKLSPSLFTCWAKCRHCVVSQNEKTRSICCFLTVSKLEPWNIDEWFRIMKIKIFSRTLLLWVHTISWKISCTSPWLFLFQIKNPKIARRSETPTAAPTTGPTGNSERETEKVPQCGFIHTINKGASNLNASVLRVLIG